MSKSQSIAFIGLGNMGGPMAANLAKAGFNVRAFDLSDAARAQAAQAGCEAANSLPEAVKDADAVVTMLPAGKHVAAVYGGEEGVFAHASKGALFCDCSTIDVPTARAVAVDAVAKGFAMVDSPVSGGVAAAEAGTLAFMVGGAQEAFKRAESILDPMAKAVIHAGDAGAGQAAKICNNMLLGISMIGTCEAFVLAEKLGLDPERFFDIASKASGQNWSLTSYCPVPGPVPAAPSNRDYAPGFATAMMLKDLRLAQEAAHTSGAATPLGAEAQALYAMFDNLGGREVDFSGIIKMLRGDFER
jgi:3-hydroxyisobutyrate dehydrogenase